jgi:hypothetical protein
VSAITSGIETVVQNLVSLMQPTVLHYAAVHKGPPFLVPASVMDVLAGDPEKYQSMLLDMQVSSDNELRPLVMKRLQQQQDPPHGAGQVWSKEEEEGAWLTAADHAAQGALLLAQIANPSITDMNVLGENPGTCVLGLLRACLRCMDVISRCCTYCSKTQLAAATLQQLHVTVAGKLLCTCAVVAKAGGEGVPRG